MSDRQLVMTGNGSIIGETLIQANLGQYRYVAVGGAIMDLNGLRPAHDIDIVIETEGFDDFLQTNKTVSGLVLTAMKSGIGQRRLLSSAPAEGLLPLDINCFAGPLKAARFNRLYERAIDYEYDGHVIRGATLADVKADKSRLTRSKARQGRDVWDICLIEGFQQRANS